jgi:hypothetical protein
MPQQGFAQAPVPAPGVAPAPYPGAPAPQGYPQPMPRQMPQNPYQMQAVPPQYGYGVPQQPKKTFAIIALISGILSLLLFFIQMGQDLDTYNAKELESNCSTWIVLFWVGLAALVVSIVFVVMCFVKKNRSPLAIAALVVASIALILFFVSASKYSDVSDKLDLAKQYTKYYSYYDY